MTKGRLIFIGLGLNDENDITVKGLQVLQHCDVVYAEFYTSRLMGTTLHALEKKFGKHIHVLNRTDVENASRVLDDAETKTVALLIGGDPMMATTHIDLRLRAIKRGIQTTLIHNSSIITAAPGLLGLQNYKFGRTTTLAYPEKNYFPLSPYSVIQENTALGLHTLILLDIKAEQDRYMTANEGFDLLLRMEHEQQKNIITKDRIACVIARAGSPETLVAADAIEHLHKKEFGPPLHTIVIPGNLHFLEVEALITLAGLPQETAHKIQKL